MMDYKVNIKDGVVYVEAPVVKLVEVRQRLLEIYQDEVVAELKREFADTKSNKWGLVSRVARKFNCSSANVMKILPRYNIELQHNVVTDVN